MHCGIKKPQAGLVTHLFHVRISSKLFFHLKWKITLYHKHDDIVSIVSWFSPHNTKGATFHGNLIYQMLKKGQAF